MSNLSVIEVDGLLVVDSRLVAERLNIQHETFMKTVAKYKRQIEARFGIIRFEVGEIRGRGKPEKFAYLTEAQASSLMTFSRNTDEVVEAKLDLVDAFEKAKTLIKTIVAHPEVNRKDNLLAAMEIARAAIVGFKEEGVDGLLAEAHALTVCGQQFPEFQWVIDGVKALLPQQKSLQSDEILLTPTAVGEKFDPPIKPRQVNKILLDLELQQLTGESQPRYKLTDKGKTYGKVVLNQGKNAGKTVQQVLWYPSVVDAIEEAI